MDNDEIDRKLIEIFEKSKVEIHLKNEGVLLATANFILGKTELRGWKIMKSKYSDEFWIQASNYGISSNRKPFLTFWTDNEELDAIIKCKLTEAYENEKSKDDARTMPF